MLAVAFGVAAFLNAESPTMLMNAMFCLAGIGWATINVNSFPMVVEMCSGSDVGRYTGFYYTASMAAQVVTPMFSGFLMDKLGMTVLFPYATIFVAGAFVTMLFVRHGDSRPIPAKGLEALDVDDCPKFTFGGCKYYGTSDPQTEKGRLLRQPALRGPAHRAP